MIEKSETKMEKGNLLKIAMEKNKEIKEAVEDFEAFINDAEIKRLLDIAHTFELDENSALAEVRNNGFEEGLKFGLEKGELKKQIEIAQNLFKLDMSITQIAEVTDLTEREIIELKIRQLTN